MYEIIQANIVKDGSQVSILIEGKNTQVIYVLTAKEIVEAAN